MKSKLYQGLGYLIFDILNKAIPFAISPFISYKLGVSQFGLYSTKLVIYNLMIVLIGWGVHSFTLVGLSKSNKDKETIVSNSGSLVVRNLVLVSVLALIFAMFSDSIDILELVSIVMCSGVYSLMQIRLSLFQFERNIFKFGILNVTFSLAIFASVIISVYYIESVHYIWSVAVVLIFLHMLCFSYTPHIFNSLLKIPSDIQNYCFNQLPHLLSNWVKLGVDRFLLAIYLTTFEVGIYSIALQFGLIVSVVNQSVNRAWTPILFNKLSTTSSVFNLKKTICTISLIPVFVGMAVWIVSNYIIYIIFPGFEGGDINLVKIIVLAYVFHGIYLVNSNYLYYYNQTRRLSAISMFSTIIHCIASLYFISEFGLVGATYALVVGWFSQMVLLFISFKGLKEWEKC